MTRTFPFKIHIILLYSKSYHTLSIPGYTSVRCCFRMNLSSTDNIDLILRTVLDFQTIKADFLLKDICHVTYTLRMMRAFSLLRKADSSHTRTHAG